MDKLVIKGALTEEITRNFPIHVFEKNLFRVVQITNFPPVPCGGTHCVTLGEILAISIKKIKVKTKFGV